MTMHIAICDDDGSAAAELEKRLRAYAAQKGLSLSVSLYTSGESFIQDGQPYDILFMDVCLPGVSGVEAVRQTGAAERHPVVFVTSSRDYAVEAFGLRAAHYLVKPLTAEAVAEAMERCLSLISLKPSAILAVKTGHDVIPVPLERVQYIEVHNKLSVIHTDSGDMETYTPLDSLFEQIPGEGFMKPQRSFVVNMSYIESFFFDRLRLQNGVEITLSRPNRPELKAQYQRYLFGLARRGSR